MIPHIHTLFEFISIPYENQHQTLNIKKIDRGQIKFRENSIMLLSKIQLCYCNHIWNEPTAFLNMGKILLWQHQHEDKNFSFAKGCIYIPINYELFWSVSRRSIRIGLHFITTSTSSKNQRRTNFTPKWHVMFLKESRRVPQSVHGDGRSAFGQYFWNYRNLRCIVIVEPNYVRWIFSPYHFQSRNTRFTL